MTDFWNSHTHTPLIHLHRRLSGFDRHNASIDNWRTMFATEIDARLSAIDNRLHQLSDLSNHGVGAQKITDFDVRLQNLAQSHRQLQHAIDALSQSATPTSDESHRVTLLETAISDLHRHRKSDIGRFEELEGRVEELTASTAATAPHPPLPPTVNFDALRSDISSEIDEKLSSLKSRFNGVIERFNAQLLEHTNELTETFHQQLTQRANALEQRLQVQQDLLQHLQQQKPRDEAKIEPELIQSHMLEFMDTTSFNERLATQVQPFLDSHRMNQRVWQCEQICTRLADDTFQRLMTFQRQIEQIAAIGEQSTQQPTSSQQLVQLEQLEARIKAVEQKSAVVTAVTSSSSPQPALSQSSPRGSKSSAQQQHRRQLSPSASAAAKSHTAAAPPIVSSNRTDDAVTRTELKQFADVILQKVTEVIDKQQQALTTLCSRVDSMSEEVARLRARR